ncbi:glutamate--tRNA ligase [Gangjinia marincola]|uniref:Glutamate--tRNA ligase n=1 Tax=Gangjinia marincola TaxID=578463 RepID=A0ABN1MHT6_9FLAO
MTKNVRVRFAPSPTGPLHIGGVRTALFNYLFAKKHYGTFVLRIEDTDQNRYVKGAEQYIIDALKWCNIPYDEGPLKERVFSPYRQSERKEIYRQYADQLIATNNAYYAFDTAAELDHHRKDHEAKGKTFIYNWHNRLKLKNSLALSSQEVQKRLDASEDYVIRFKTPQDETLTMFDEIRGEISIDTNTLDDKVLFKSDGMPTYHLANIVDDHLMEISHVIRGEEWLPSMPLHMLLYRAFDWKAPKFAHLPLILKPVGKGKLSKRDGDKMGFPVFPLAWKDPATDELSAGYRENGYQPEAVVNMLAFLGWNPGTAQEIFSIEELVQAFDLERINKSGAKFDPEKTKWFQQHYFQERDNESIATEFKELLKDYDVHAADERVLKAVEMLKERAVFTKDLWDLGHFLFVAPVVFDEKAAKKAWKDGTATLMGELAQKIETIETFNVENLTNQVKEWIGQKEVGFGKVMMPFRLALVGSLQGPDVFEITAFVGKRETIERIRFAIDSLS